MKRFAILCLVATGMAAFGAPAWSQNPGVGLKLGFSLARVDETSTEPLPYAWKDLPFFTAGLYFEQSWGLLTIQPEILYVQQGGTFDIDSANGLKNRYHYFQLPVQLKLNVAPGSAVEPFVAGGAYGAYLLRAESLLKIDGETTKAYVTSDYKRWDWGVVGSAGLAFRMPGITVSIEGRYNYGLMNILKYPFPGESVKNRCWMALIGLRY
jgi:hypothetical protein